MIDHKEETISRFSDLVAVANRGRVTEKLAEDIAATVMKMRRILNTTRVRDAVLDNRMTPGSWPIEARRIVVHALLRPRGNMCSTTHATAAILFGVSTPVISNDLEKVGIPKAKPGRPAKKKSLARALDSANRPSPSPVSRPPATEVQEWSLSDFPVQPVHTPVPPQGDHMMLALSATLEQIGKTRDPARYAGLISEIGRTLSA